MRLIPHLGWKYAFRKFYVTLGTKHPKYDHYQEDGKNDFDLCLTRSMYFRLQANLRVWSREIDFLSANYFWIASVAKRMTAVEQDQVDTQYHSRPY